MTGGRLPTFAVLAALALAQLPPPTTQPLPLIVERVEFVDDDRFASRLFRTTEVTLFNSGSRTIHAFGIRTQLTFADARTNGGGLSTDRYENPDPPPQDVRGECGGALTPQRRCTVMTTPSGDGRNARDVAKAEAAITFVIFEDNTAAGDEREIEFYFGHRALNHRAWPVIEKIVTDAIAQGGDAFSTLFTIREELGHVKGDVRLSRAFQSFDSLLAMNLKRPKADYALYLQWIAEDVRKRRARAAAHYQRVVL